MFAQSWPAEIKPPNTIPKDIYASHVDALFSDARSLLIGVVAAFLTTFITALNVHQTDILGISVTLAVLGGVRLVAIRAYRLRRPTLDIADLHKWEQWYVLGGSAHVALLGLFCFATFALTTDASARLASIAITMAYLIGTPGRSFANDLLVNAQILAAAAPMMAALAIAGHAYWYIVFFVLLPFFMALKTISTRLRGIFMSAVLRTKDLGDLAGRFDTALNNMPQGLAMFDAEAQITVSNKRLLHLLQLPPHKLKPGETFEALLNACAEAGAVSQASATGLWKELKTGLNASAARDWILSMADGRSVEFRLQVMNDGGGVILAEDVTERLRAQASITYLARFDSLTGLPNRHSFREHVQRLIDAHRARSGALIFIDLDRFKQVNDTLGHVLGDKLLASVSERLRAVIGPAGMVARFGGDEFVIFQTFADPREGSTQLASLLIERMSGAFDVDGHKIVIGTSLGIAIAADHGGNVDDLLRDADLALYRAKAEGRGTFRFFEGQMQAQARARRDIEKDLRDALARNEFELHYQPIYNLTANRFLVCEALIRWNHPQRGTIPPSDFIPVAEEMGLIGEIGNWVLHQACRECARWPSDITVAVNISAVQFRQGNILGSVRQAIKEGGITPNRLEIEITETALLQDLQTTRRVLHQLRDVGVRVSLDDFGTGYSSLSYLQSLPFSKVKIDRSFLQGLDWGSRALMLLRGITRLSAELGMSVVMEGVETAEQLALVTKGARITDVQGYFFSHPLPSDQLLSLLRRQAKAAVA